ncbi:MAG: PilZ domain-containing protein [Syntrophales bacterium]|jgi:c-di-GMP-binding flagellar brake protein YcgR
MSKFLKDNRRLFRREINLECSYWKHTSSGFFDKIEKATVVNLSTGGCRIHVSDDHNLHRKDSITLVFKLDNPDRTEIQQETVVRWVIGNFIGCKFSFEHDSDIWFYVHKDIPPK